jgi:GTP-binding protein
MSLFVDEAEIVVKAGRGGDGAIAFLHEKYRPMGGPAGGDGGRGGDVIFKADRNTSSLWEIARQRQFRAKNGRPGEGKNRHGKDGVSLILNVPLGTLVREIKDGPILYDLSEHGIEVIVAEGGKGGKGNLKFATPTNRAPRVAEEGKDPEERRLYLELRLIADVGLVGLPNAGKSTLISRVSAAHPKVAPYPFTTRRPELGVVSAGNFRNIVIADLPGLIEGAHEGVGLGDAFLRHIERTRLIAHLVELMPPTGTPFENYLSIRRELKLYSKELAKKPEIIVLTKADLDPDESRAKEFLTKFEALRKKKTKDAALVPPRLPNADTFCVAISAVTGYNIDRLLRTFFDAVARLPVPEMR